MSNILLIDNDKMVASGLACLLAKGNRVKLAHNMDDMTYLLVKHPFDMAILDVRMNDKVPDIHFLDVLLKQTFPVLLLTGAATKEELVEYIRKGALGLVRKGDMSQTLHLAVAALLSGNNWIPQEITDALRQAVIKRMLTPREQDILDYFFLDKAPKNSQIAKAEKISINTVRNHVSALMMKCGVNSRHHLKAKASVLGYAASGRKVAIE